MVAVGEVVGGLVRFGFAGVVDVCWALDAVAAGRASVVGSDAA